MCLERIFIDAENATTVSPGLVAGTSAWWEAAFDRDGGSATHPLFELGLEPELAAAAIEENERQVDLLEQRIKLAEDAAPRLRAGESLAVIADDFGVTEQQIVEALEMVCSQRPALDESNVCDELRRRQELENEALARRGWRELARREVLTFGRVRVATVRQLMRQGGSMAKRQRPRRRPSRQPHGCSTRRRGSRRSRGSPSGRPERSAKNGGEPSPPQAAAPPDAAASLLVEPDRSRSAHRRRR